MNVDKSKKIELGHQVIQYAKALVKKGVGQYDAYHESVEVFGKQYPDLTFDIIEEYDKKKAMYVVTTVGIT